MHHSERAQTPGAPQTDRRSTRPRPVVWLGAATALATAALLAGPAQALAGGTVTMTGAATKAVTLNAGAGDTNDVTTSGSRAQVTVTDSGATLSTASAGCANSSPNTVVCTGPAIIQIVANLGNQNDRMVNNAALDSSSSIFAGTGNDTIQGGPDIENISGEDGNDTLSGGPGGDQLNGGPATDTIEGEAGNDRLGDENDGVADTINGGPDDDRFTIIRPPFASSSPGNDVMRGGPGVDTVDIDDVDFEAFGTPSPPFRLTLDDGIANDGFMGEAMNIAEMEDARVLVSNTAFIRGTSAANVLNTFDSNDDVDLRAGADIAFLRGGNDTVEARDGFSDRISCGAGNDTAQVDQLDVTDYCETVSRTFVQPPGTTGTPPAAPVSPAPAEPAIPAAPAAPDVTAPVCSTSAPGTISDPSKAITVTETCDEASALEMTLTGRVLRVRGAGAARSGDLTLAAASLPWLPGTRTVKLSIPPKLRRGLARNADLRLRVEATDASGNRSGTSTTVRLRRKRT